MAATLTVARDVGWNLPILVLIKGKGLILVVALTRLVSLDGLGVWAQANVVASLVLVLGSFGLYQALVQFYPGASEERRARLVWTALLATTVCGAVLAGVVALTRGHLAVLFADDPSVAGAFAWSGGLGAVWGVRFLLLQHLRARGELKRYSLALGAAEVTDLVGAIGFAALGRSVEAALAGSFAGAVLFTGFLLRQVLALGPPRVSRAELTELSQYGMPVAWSQLADTLLARGDRLLIGATLGGAATGLYAAVYALVSAPNVLANSLVSVLFPRLAARTWSSADSRRVGLLAALTYVAASAVFLVLLTLVHEPVLALLLGAAAAPHDVNVPWLILLTGVGVAAFGAGRIVSLDLFTERRTRTVAVVWMGSAAANLGLNALLLPRLGVVGAGLATLVANVGFVATMGLAVRRLRALVTPDAALADPSGSRRRA